MSPIELELITLLASIRQCTVKAIREILLDRPCPPAICDLEHIISKIDAWIAKHSELSSQEMENRIS